MYSVSVLLLLLDCFIFILVLSVCCVSRSSLCCNIPFTDLCTLCLSCYYFYIVLSLLLYCCYVVYPDHHFTVIYYLQTCVLCFCLVIISTLCYLDACTVAMLCIQIITLLLYTFRLVYTVFVLLLLLHWFIFIFVLLLCFVSRSSLYCNIPFTDLSTLCLSCYYFYIVLSL